jgi:3-isopropylmalate dehydrogenase
MNQSREGSIAVFMQADIVVLAGDGIGAEVVPQGVRVLRSVGDRFGHVFRFTEQPIGGTAIDEFGDPLPEFSLGACQKANAVLLGAVGGPKWDDPAASVRPEQGLLRLRKGLGLYANLRPIKVFPALRDATPLKAGRVSGVDILIVRELTGGLYFGEPRFRKRTPEGVRAVDTLEYSEREIRRIVRLALQLAQGRRGKVTSVDKANVLETSRLWRQIATEEAAAFPHVTLEHQLVDSAAMRLITHPRDFDVIVTENMFGDILSDEASVLSGSLGLAPSASLGEGRLGVYEPIHGSAPDILGKGIANPLATILSVAMLLRYSLELTEEADCVDAAVARAIDEKDVTPDLGGALSTEEVGEAVCEQIKASR